jgi:hypothetical protein
MAGVQKGPQGARARSHFSKDWTGPKQKSNICRMNRLLYIEAVAINLPSAELGVI